MPAPHPNDIQALSEMARCVTDDGRVLLLEHGASWFPLLRWWQRHRLNRHVVRYGCYWDRDIEARRTSAALWPYSGRTISAASRQHPVPSCRAVRSTTVPSQAIVRESGLKVIDVKRKHLGTTFLITCQKETAVVTERAAAVTAAA